jgi:hypothetical protein
VLGLALALGATLVIASAGGTPNKPISLSAQNSAAIQKINAIRTSFHRSAGAVTVAYNDEVLKGIRSNDDPPFAPFTGNIEAEYSLWGIVPGWTSSSVEVVNDWVYHDGWMGSTAKTLNGDCTSASASGCNGHRRAVLSSPPSPGARLEVDIQTRQIKDDGAQYLSVAALFIWSR